MPDERPSLLIVDPDEPFSAALAAEATEAGFNAICCRTWWEARPVLEEAHDIAGMIVELVLPERTPNGVSVALMARARRHRLPVVFMSAQPDLLRDVQPGTGRTLSKTVGPKRLVACAMELIDNEQRQRPLAQVSITPQVSLSPVARYRLDEATCFRSVNDSALAFWQKSRGELLGRPFLDVFPQVDGQPKFRAHLDALSGGEPFSSVVQSVILADRISIQIAPDSHGLRISFARAA